MDEILRQILAELRELKSGQEDLAQQVKELSAKLDESDRLIVGEIRGFKNEMRDFKSEVKGWQRYTDARLDSLDGTLGRMRDSLQ